MDAIAIYVFEHVIFRCVLNLHLLFLLNKLILFYNLCIIFAFSGTHTPLCFMDFYSLRIPCFFKTKTEPHSVLPYIEKCKKKKN